MNNSQNHHLDSAFTSKSTATQLFPIRNPSDDWSIVNYTILRKNYLLRPHLNSEDKRFKEADIESQVKTLPLLFIKEDATNSCKKPLF